MIGPEKQCIVLDKNAEKLKKALETTTCLQLENKRGVYWLPLKASQEPFGEVPVLAATRAAKKVVPAKAQDAAMDAGEPAPSSDAGGTAPAPDAGGTAPAPSVRDAAQELPRLGEPVSEASEAVRKPRAKKIPDLVSEQEYNDHMRTHLPFRNWCEHCIAGKSREDAHPLRTPKERKGEVPRLSMDYCFLGRALKGEVLKDAVSKDGLLPILVMVDQETGCTFSAVVSKGVNPYSVHMVVELLKFLGFLGRQKVILMTDGEPAIKALAEAAARQIGTGAQLQHGPKETHGPSNGAAERAVLEVARQVRTLVHAVETKYPGLHSVNEDVIYPWLVRHASWLITRY